MYEFDQYLIADEPSLAYQYSHVCGELSSLYLEVSMMTADEVMTKSRGYITAAQSDPTKSHASCERAGEYEAQSIVVAIMQLRGKINRLAAEKEFIEYCLRRISAPRERLVQEGGLGQHQRTPQVGLPAEPSSSYLSQQPA